MELLMVCPTHSRFPLLGILGARVGISMMTCLFDMFTGTELPDFATMT